MCWRTSTCRCCTKCHRLGDGSATSVIVVDISHEWCASTECKWDSLCSFISFCIIRTEEVDHPYDECPLKRLMPFLRPPSRMCSQMMLWEPLCVVFLRMILADSNIVSLSAGYKRKERQIPSGSLPFVTCDTVITVTCVLSHLLVLYLSVLGITSRYLCPVATFHGCAFLFQESWQKRWHK